MSQTIQSLLKSLDKKSDWTGLRRVNNKSLGLSVRDEKLASHRIEDDSGLMIEVLLDGQWGYAGTSHTSSEALKATYEKALEMARQAKAFPLAQFTEEQRPSCQGEYHTSQQDPWTEDHSKELFQRLLEATKKMKPTPGVVARSASSEVDQMSVEFVSTSGSSWVQQFSFLSINQSVTADKNGDTQTRTNGSRVTQSGFEFFNEGQLYEDTERICKEVSELLDAPNCPSDSRSLILMPDQIYLQIHESIGHPLELDRILGDERNYAGWSFVKPSDFGQLQYGSPLLNVTFDPGYSQGVASYNYDDTGAPAQKEYLIKEGQLLAGIGGLDSQSRSKLKGVSSARATSWNRAPIDRMANINMEPGDSSIEKMISQTEKGILMATNKSWSIDDYRNKFQFGCEYGRLIEDGELKQVVKNPNYRGRCTPFWKSLKAVSAHSENWGSFYCGKGEPNQVIKVGHASPVCLFENVEVFGGHS